MPVSNHIRKSKVRKHINRTFGSHLNGKVIDRKIEYLHLKQGKQGKGVK